MNIRGIGLDIVDIERVLRASMRSPRFVGRICTPPEAEYCVGDPSGKRLAGRFAAKEAVGKAIGVPLSWQDVEVLPDAAGRPQVRLHRRAKLLVGNGAVMVSITHTDTVAAATALWTEG